MVVFFNRRRHIGVYYLVITLTPNLTLYEVATFQPDGTFDTIDSLQDGNLFSSTPSFGPYSNLKGVWECDGPNRIVVNTLNFNYPTQLFPRYVSTAVYNLQFSGNHQVSGTVANTDYDLASTANSNRSQWEKIAGPFRLTFKATSCSKDVAIKLSKNNFTGDGRN